MGAEKAPPMELVLELGPLDVWLVEPPWTLAAVCGCSRQWPSDFLQGLAASYRARPPKAAGAPRQYVSQHWIPVIAAAHYEAIITDAASPSDCNTGLVVVEMFLSAGAQAVGLEKHLEGCGAQFSDAMA